jgi:hypothetical protein
MPRVDRGAAHKNFYLANLGAFLALCAKNQAFRYNNAAWHYVPGGVIPLQSFARSVASRPRAAAPFFSVVAVRRICVVRGLH